MIAFVSELTSDDKHPPVETIIAMGNHMNLDVIAQGVETEKARDILISLGCKVFQGYYYSRPLPESAFLEWLDKSSTTSL